MSKLPNACRILGCWVTFTIILSPIVAFNFKFDSLNTSKIGQNNDTQRIGFAISLKTRIYSKSTLKLPRASMDECNCTHPGFFLERSGTSDITFIGIGILLIGSLFLRSPKAQPSKLIVLFFWVYKPGLVSVCLHFPYARSINFVFCQQIGW